MSFFRAPVNIVLISMAAAAVAQPIGRSAATAEPLRVESFSELQAIYKELVPAEMNSPAVIAAAERAAARAVTSPWESTALAVANATYQAQLSALARSRAPAEGGGLAAAQLIESSYGRVLARTQLREEPATAARLLPEPFSANLTPRVGWVGLSLQCSAHTPALARLLQQARVPCGRVPAAAPAGR